MIVEHIRQNGGAGAPDALADGEFYVDEAAGMLYLAAASQIYGIPLAVTGMPAIPGDADLTLARIAGVPTFSVIEGGGGGQAFDGQPWRVPGVVPLLPQPVSLSAGNVYYSLFEMAKADTLAHVMVSLTAGSSTTGEYGVCAWSENAPGLILAKSTFTGGAGAYTDDVSVALPPGVYATFFRAAGDVQVLSMLAQLRQPRLAALDNAGYVAEAATLPAVGHAAPAVTSIDSPHHYPIALGF